MTPFGEIIADRARGQLFGNRGGRIHDPATKTLLRRRFSSTRWIACVLSFKGRRRALFGPGFTELFFLDEATALAAGHRPCFECRRSDAALFARAFADGQGLERPLAAGAMDAILHAERLGPGGGKRLHPLPPGALPDGAMVAVGAHAFRVASRRLLRWTPEGYTDDAPGDGDRRLLTPPSMVAALLAGYRIAENP